LPIFLRQKKTLILAILDFHQKLRFRMGLISRKAQKNLQNRQIQSTQNLIH